MFSSRLGFLILSPGPGSDGRMSDVCQEGPGVCCGLETPGEERREEVRWTPDSDNRGPRPGVRCQVDRGRMAEVRPANQRPGSGTISQSEDSVTQLNNYHITQGIL